MSATWRSHPFLAGTKYRVKLSFTSRDHFAQGETLTFCGTSYSHYDSISTFKFVDEQDALRCWDIHDEEGGDLFIERFEQTA